ncbi:GIP [Symbiodinium necroappetens]|uniref:GIP protein n=1 Tax=Symbiodinium necroappetens TaxID=1628268 RepID=A0A812WJ77_9DINO|nr:GIP [Symbiodinium necroappetens]
MTDPGKFLILDTKLLSALTKVARGELAREILILKETEAKTNEKVGSLYSVQDLLKVRLLNDDLSTFLSNWEGVISGLSHMPDETTLRDIFLRELRQSKKIKYDFEIYDRAKEGSEQHTYLFLKNSIKEMLTRERKCKNRDRIARSHGDKYGAAASPRSASPSRRGGREKSQSPRGSRPRSPGRGRSPSPNKSRSTGPKGYVTTS